MIKLIALMSIFTCSAYSACSIDGIIYNSGESIKVTSSHRTPEHNKKVGGVKNSNHLTPCGARDVLKKPIKDLEGFIEYIKKSGLRVIEYPYHLHIDIGHPDGK